MRNDRKGLTTCPWQDLEQLGSGVKEPYRRLNQGGTSFTGRGKGWLRKGPACMRKGSQQAPGCRTRGLCNCQRELRRTNQLFAQLCLDLTSSEGDLSRPCDTVARSSCTGVRGLREAHLVLGSLCPLWRVKFGLDQTYGV